MPVDVSVPFRPAVPVFDGHAALGRRYDRRADLDTPEDLLAEMDRCGIERALVYHPHAAHYSTREGNALLMELVAGQPRLVPQFVANPVFDDPEAFGEKMRAAGVRSVRFCPKTNLYPFVRWVAGRWLDWLRENGLALWLPADEVDLTAAYDTLSAYQELPVVLVAPTYGQVSTVLPLMGALPHLHLDLSRWDVYEGPIRARDSFGAERLLYGSNLPEFEPGSYLFHLHRCGFSEAELRAICGGNLERLLGEW
ncbi:MAG: amidohydrolase family protein [Armatimonadetes bacterium]|nr:amidohydrolase family protein [Armatimonadota bacterium]